MSDLLFRMVAKWAVTTRTSGNELPGQRENFGIFPDERSAKQALADAGFTNTEFGWRLVGGYTSADIEKQVVYEQTESAAEITRLTEALAASEEARRAERAAVVRECAHTAYVACAETRHGILGDRCHAAICRIATDADNAALDKMLREARVVKKLEWSEPLTPMNSGCAYDNCTATVGKLEYRIEWKSWKQDAGYAVFLDDNYVADGGDTLEEAKTAAQDHLQSVADGILAALEAPQ